MLGVRKVEVQNAKCKDDKFKIIVYDQKTRKKETSRSIFRRTGINCIQIFLKIILPQVENNNNINEHFLFIFLKTSLDKLVKLSG